MRLVTCGHGLQRSSTVPRLKSDVTFKAFREHVMSAVMNHSGEMMIGTVTLDGRTVTFGTVMMG